LPLVAERSPDVESRFEESKGKGAPVEWVKEINATAPILIDGIRSGELNIPEAKRMAWHEVRKERKAFALGVPSVRFDSGLSRHEPTLGRGPKTLHA